MFIYTAHQLNLQYNQTANRQSGILPGNITVNPGGL